MKRCKACGGPMVARGTRETRPLMILRRTVCVYRCARCKVEEEVWEGDPKVRARPIARICRRCGLSNPHYRKSCMRCGEAV